MDDEALLLQLLLVKRQVGARKEGTKGKRRSRLAFGEWASLSL
jgi:hypothetical protein